MASYEQILEQINNSIDREVNLFNVQLETVLKTIESLVAVRAVELYTDPLQFDFAFQRILQESGYYNLVNGFINESYDKNYNEIIALFEAGGLAATFSEADVTNIKAIKQLKLDFFRDVGNETASQLKRDLFKYSLSDLDSATMVQNMKDSLAGTNLVKHSSTYVDTGISNFIQDVIELKNKEFDHEAYIYTGARPDSKIRSFCECVIRQRKYYSESDAGRLRADKRREYNCRHFIIGVSVEYALQNGYKEGSFSC